MLFRNGSVVFPVLFFQAWYISRNTVSAAMPIESRRLPPMEVWGKNGEAANTTALKK